MVHFRCDFKALIFCKSDIPQTVEITNLIVMLKSKNVTILAVRSPVGWVEP
ncbi:MAG: hypothetical protein V7K21_21960 [Nostoc sp.]|uniref:hypothetical protein n=1 Tax=Nostoc sp. TaxID=1180 RepID=UPI002FF8ECD0